MEQARAKNFTKHISAVVSTEDYEFLKRTSDNYELSLGDVIRGLIKISKSEVEVKLREERKNKQPRLF